MKRPHGSRRGGFQLAELLVSILIFSLVGGLCFYAAASGFRIFAHTSSRQALQRDARAIFTWLQRDVGLSNLLRCQRLERNVDGHQRDALAVAAMDSWQQPLKVDVLDLPSWNRVVVYQVTTKTTPGILLRQLYLPPSGATPLEPAHVLQLLTDAVTGPVGSVTPVDQRRLSGAVRDFSVVLLEGRNAVKFSLTLLETTVDGSSGRPRNEVLQVQTTIHPRNTWPRL